ncbi:MAG: GAF domain-containing protein [Pseudohongiellaceae bacterium]
MTLEPTASIYEALHKKAEQAAGAKLFTIMVLDNEAGLARRAYTSHPTDYPATGSKPMRQDRWSEQVIDNQKPFIANSTEGFSDVFSDHPLINALGCESVLNVPVIDRNKVVGTVNFLDAKDHFTADRVAALQNLVAAHHDALVAALASELG